MKQTCPRCENHFPADAPRCPAGREHFGLPPLEEQPGQRAITLLRRCGHFLHHNPEGAVLPEALTEQERAQLESLLEKCLTLWQA